MSEHHHRLQYLELPCTDLPAAEAFLSSCFGWAFESWGPGYSAFYPATAGLEGGLLKVEAKAPTGGPLPILYSDDLEASEATIVAAGATVTERHDFPGGRRLHFDAPGGLHLAIWTKA